MGSSGCQGPGAQFGNGKFQFRTGVHGISVGDVNNDGYDDICIGAATIGYDGKLLCATGKGHGDAIHLTDLCPDRPGLEVMMPHEEKAGGYGWDVHDATTGEFLCVATGDRDNGRGLAADFVPANRGFEFWSSTDADVRDCATGNTVIAGKSLIPTSESIGRAIHTTRLSMADTVPQRVVILHASKTIIRQERASSPSRTSMNMEILRRAIPPRLLHVCRQTCWATGARS